MSAEAVPYNIRERTFLFAVQVVKFADKFPRTIAGQKIAAQLIGAGTSVGANVEEADGAESRKDRIHKYAIARKEVKEARFWLRVTEATDLSHDSEGQALQQEALELAKIISKIIINLSKSN